MIVARIVPAFVGTHLYRFECCIGLSAPRAITSLRRPARMTTATRARHVMDMTCAPRPSRTYRSYPLEEVSGLLPGTTVLGGRG
jgi:hypothetical protein